MNGILPVAAEITLSTAMTDVVDFIEDVFGVITDNWLMVLLLLAPFAIGMLVSLIRSLRG